MNASTSCDRLWRKRLNELTAVWPDFVHGRTSGLHKTRVASRRIREALPIVGADASQAKVKKLNRKMRALTRALGPIRELDVELGILEEQTAVSGASGRALEIVRREIASRRQALGEELKDDAPVTDIKRLLRKLERIAQGKGSRRAKNDGHDAGAKSDIQLEAKWRVLLAARLMQRAKRLAMAVEDAGPIYAPERLHDVRISTKKMRYSLEIARDAGVPGATPLLKILKRHQERLGQLHDLQVLWKHVRETDTPGLGPGHDLTEYADSLDRECRRLHAGFVEYRAELVGVVKQVRQHIVPALTTPRRHLSAVARSAKVEPRVNGTRRTITPARAK